MAQTERERLARKIKEKLDDPATPKHMLSSLRHRYEKLTGKTGVGKAVQVGKLPMVAKHVPGKRAKNLAETAADFSGFRGKRKKKKKKESDKEQADIEFGGMHPIDTKYFLDDIPPLESGIDYSLGQHPWSFGAGVDYGAFKHGGSLKKAKKKSKAKTRKRASLRGGGAELRGG